MGNLRARILASYVLVVAFSLALAGVVTGVLVVRYQRQAALARRRALAVAIASDLPELAGMAREGAPAEAFQRLRRDALALGARFLVTQADGTVLRDTAQEGNLVGERLALPARAATGAWIRYRAPDRRSYYLTLIPLQRPASAQAGQPPVQYLALAVPAEDVRQAWRDVAPPLALAGLLALLACLVVGAVLSGTITRPVQRLTAATEAFARGDLGQSVPVRGADELARLAQSFNSMAQEVRRARQTERDFLANVTHDLRTPLTSIQGFSQALLEGTVDDAASYRRSAAIIHEEAGRMRRLIDSLLELARLEAGAGAVEHTRLELGSWLRAVGERFAPQAEAAGLQFELALEEPLPAVRGDALRLERALDNLLDNACKFTPAGGRVALRGRRVEVRRGRVSPVLGGEVVVGRTALRDGPWAAIQVADTGRGIAPADARRIFERFYQGDRARSDRLGAGLGLSIVRSIVLAHGGFVAVQSAPGQGTTFTVLLPAESPPS